MSGEPLRQQQRAQVGRAAEEVQVRGLALELGVGAAEPHDIGFVPAACGREEAHRRVLAPTSFKLYRSMASLSGLLPPA
jgi:hypothetical protein